MTFQRAVACGMKPLPSSLFATGSKETASGPIRGFGGQPAPRFQVTPGAGGPPLVSGLVHHLVERVLNDTFSPRGLQGGNLFESVKK